MSRLTQLTETVPVLRTRPMLRLALTLFFCVMALSVRWVIHDWLPPGYPFLTFFPAVILAAFLFGMTYGLIAAVVCGATAWFFFIPPTFSFTITAPVIVAMLFYTGVVVVDVTLVHWMQRANEHLRATREEGARLAEERGQLAERNALLFRELQHRVGNNLQLIGAVLSLQLRQLEEPVARRALSDAAGRLRVLGSIQRQLYRPGGEAVPLDAFVTEVTQQTMRSGARQGLECRIEAATGLDLPTDVAVPLALILSEAIANALEHGFDGRETGLLEVQLTRCGETVELVVRDDGAGLPEGFDPATARSLGLQISRSLVQQLAATYTLESKTPGTEMRLQLPAARFVVER